MKKLTVFSVLFVLLAGAAFAQLANGITVNAWGRGAFVPLWYETVKYDYGEKPDGEGSFKSGVGATWDPDSVPRVDFRVNGATDYVGFTVHVNSEFLDGTGNGDNGAQLWVKPFGNDWLKLTVANQLVEDALRGRVSTDTGFENFVLGKTMMKFTQGVEPLNQDVIFNRFAGGRGSPSAANPSNTSTPITQNSMLANVFLLTSSPIQGMYFGMMLQGKFPGDELKKSLRFVQYGAGYEVEGIGFARAQWVGGFFGKEEDANEESYDFRAPGKVEVAFALTAIENLVIDMGAKIWMPVTKTVARVEQTSNWGLDVALGGTYSADAFNIAAMFQALQIGSYGRAAGGQVHSPGNDKSKDGVLLAFNLIPSYDFDFGTAGLSFIFQTQAARTDNTGAENKSTAWTRFGAGAWYKKGLAGGSIKFGVAYAFPMIQEGTPRGSSEVQTGFNNNGILSIPIILEYAFF